MNKDRDSSAKERDKRVPPNFKLQTANSQNCKRQTESVAGKIDYAVYCVHEFARTHSSPYRAAFDYLDKHGGIDYILDFYVENSQQPMRLMLQDLEECCRSHGGTAI